MIVIMQFMLCGHCWTTCKNFMNYVKNVKDYRSIVIGIPRRMVKEYERGKSH